MPQSALDVMYLQWVAPILEAEIELEKYFHVELTPDRAYKLGMLTQNDERYATRLASIASTFKKPK